VWTADTAVSARVAAGGRELSGLLVVVTAGAAPGSLSAAVSYNNPEISTAVAVNGGTTGGVSLTIAGRGFGQGDLSLASRLGETVMELSFWVSDTAVIARAPEGLARVAAIAVTATLQQGVFAIVTGAFSFDGPVASSIAPGNGGSTGQNVISLYGSNFGQSDSTPAVRLDIRTCRQTVWGCARDADGHCTFTEVTCRAPQGTGPEQYLTVTVALRFSTLTESYTYDLPSANAVEPANSPVAGGLVIAVSAGGLGTEDFTPAARVGGTACEQTVFVADTAITCKVARGNYHSHDIAATVALQGGAGQRLFSYDKPTISSVSIPNSPTTGDIAATIFGANFGRTSPSPRARVGYVDCERTEWVSSSSLVCSFASGIGAAHDISVTVPSPPDLQQYGGVLIGSLTGSFSYDAPLITFVTPLNSATTGGIRLTVRGENFGPTADGNIAVTLLSGHATNCPADVGCTYPSDLSSCECVPDYAASIVAGDSYDELVPPPPPLLYCCPYPCSYCTLTVADVRQVVTTGAGVGTGLAYAVTVAGQIGQAGAGNLFSFDAPKLYLVYPNFGAQVGGTVISVIGENFGPTPTLPILTVGLWCTGVGCTEGFTECTQIVLGTQHTTVLCTIPQGTGSQISAVATISDQTATLANSFSYAQPQPNLAFPKCAPTTGGSFITINGENFGRTDNNQVAKVGLTTCQSTTWTSDSLVSCELSPGVGKQLGLEVESNGQSGTRANSFSYKAPHITAIEPGGGGTTGGYLTTITGDNFGLYDYTPEASLGGFACGATAYTSDTSVSCEAPPGAGQQPVLVSVGGQGPQPESDITVLFCYDPPKVTKVVAANSATSGGAVVTVYGANFGIVDTSPVISFGVTGSAGPASTWVSDSTITTKVHSGVGKDLSVFAVLGGLTGSITTAFSFDKPKVDSITPRAGPTSGSFTLTVAGVNFGQPASATLGGEAGSVAAVTATQLKLLVPEGTGVNKGVTVDISSQVGTSPQAFSYSAPTVSSIDPNNAPTSGGFTVTVSGANFGSAQTITDSLVDVTIGSVACTGVASATAHTAVTCVVAEGAGTGFRVVVEVDSQASPSLTQASPLPPPLPPLVLSGHAASLTPY